MTASKVAEHFRLCPDSPSYVAWARDSRGAAKPENQWNRKVNANNTTQIKGLCWNEANQNWQGCIHHNKKLHKKCSVDRSVVEAWLITKRQELHGEFSRNN